MAKRKLTKPPVKKTLYLHIGRHKTGTTSLQHFFSQKSDLLAERGILYPKTGRITPHGVADTAHHNVSHILRYKSDAEIDALFQTLSEEAEGFDAILLSSEDFQNLKDLDRLAELFENYDVTVIAYLREGLGYGLSGFAQRIHSSGEIFNIRQYMERQNIRISRFIKNWTRLADKPVFRLYERDKLKNRDIVEDFLDIIGLEDIDDTTVQTDSNPSLSGNLLGLKMLLNLMGQSMLIPYMAFELAARLDPTFSGKIFVTDRIAEELRGLDDYNAVLKSMFPDMSEPSFESGSKVFDLSRWDSDMDLIATIPEFSFAKTLRLGGLGQVLKNHGVAGDLGETDFLNDDMIKAIRLPDGVQTQQIRARAVAAVNDATVARKARAEAERAAAKAKEDTRLAVISRDEMAEKLKSRTKKLEKDLVIALEKMEVVKNDRDGAIDKYKSAADKAVADRDAARAELKSQAEKMQSDAKATLTTFNQKIAALTSDRDALNAQVKTISEKSAEDIKALKAKAETALKDRDAARAELKSQAEKMQSDAKAALATFNEKIAALTSDRDALNLQLNTVSEKSAEDIKALKAQAKTAVKDRDAARAELKSQAEKMQSDAKATLTTFNERIAALTTDRDALNAQVKTVSEKSAEDIKALKAKAETALKDRDAARAELKSQAEKMQSDAKATLTTFNERIAALTTDRDKSYAKLKSQAKAAQSETKKLLENFNDRISTLTADREALAKKFKDLAVRTADDLDVLKRQAERAIKDRDEARNALTAKDLQIRKQAGQICYFRGELHRLKGDGEKAQEFYAKAVEQDPDNEDYHTKLETYS